MNSVHNQSTTSDRNTLPRSKMCNHVPEYHGSDLRKMLQEEQGIARGHSSLRGSARELDRERE